MSPVLVEAVRWYREQTTEQLLALWETNDRVMWSPEAFEAIKSLLIERGVDELPPQKPPAPLAERHSPTGDPVADYWLGWLRPVLWIGIVVSSLALLYQAVAALDGWRTGENFWLDGRWDNVVASLQYMVLPALLITASVAGFRLVPWSRTALLTYAWVSFLSACRSSCCRFAAPRMTRQDCSR